MNSFLNGSGLKHVKQFALEKKFDFNFGNSVKFIGVNRSKAGHICAMWSIWATLVASIFPALG